jgi:hypothetical protein
MALRTKFKDPTLWFQMVSDPIGWDEAGIADEDGLLGKRVPSGFIGVPGSVSISPDGERLEFHFDAATKFKKPNRAMLNRFVRLHESTPNSVYRFARTWGVLAAPNGRPCEPGCFKGSEPISAWTYFSRRACGLLSLAAAMRLGKFGSGEQWEAIGRVVARPGEDYSRHLDAQSEAAGEHGMGVGVWDDRAEGISRRERLRQMTGAIRFELETWMDLAGVRLGVSADRDGRFDLSVQYGRGACGGFLFAAIALQLTLAVAGADSLFFCDGCHLPYVRCRERKSPGHGRANFCEECGCDDAAARRMADARRRVRVAEAKQLAAGGMPVKKIALRLKTKSETVLRWLDRGVRKNVKPRVENGDSPRFPLGADGLPAEDGGLRAHEERGDAHFRGGREVTDDPTRPDRCGCLESVRLCALAAVELGHRSGCAIMWSWPRST